MKGLRIICRNDRRWCQSNSTAGKTPNNHNVVIRLKPLSRFTLILLAFLSSPLLSSPAFAETIMLLAADYIDTLNGDLIQGAMEINVSDPSVLNSDFRFA